MSLKSKSIFKKEIKHSIIFWGCEYGSEGEDYYKDYIIPMNLGDTITRDDYQYKVTSKDWDFDNQTIYFVFSKIK